MRRAVPVVDLFSGPGGLAEGFSALRTPSGRSRFPVALSIEKDPFARRTLRLRAFLRKFGADFPPEYYDFLNGMTAGEPDWAELHPGHWAAADRETVCMELGTGEANVFLHRRLGQLREEHGGRTVLLGGPPCQVYSVAGRSRNAGKVGYDADEDHRLLLYEHYVRALWRLRPVVAVMENVKGMLSVRRNGTAIFPEVMQRLRHAAGIDAYRLFALAPACDTASRDGGPEPKDYLVRAEEHGVPQARHRVFVICVRSDVAATLPEEWRPRLERRDDRVSVQDVIGSMPGLRSRLSGGDDARAWQHAVRTACERILANRPGMSRDEDCRFREAIGCARAAADRRPLPWRNAYGQVALPEGCPADLREWIFDEKIETLSNNETRRHVAADLERYLFAAVYARAFERFPKTSDFPEAFMPPHVNWHTGKFDDRYRVQLEGGPSTTVTSHLSKDGHYFIHPDPGQCRSLTVREVARLQTFPDNYYFHGSRTQQYVQVGNAVPPFLAHQIAGIIWHLLRYHDRGVRGMRRHSRNPCNAKPQLPWRRHDGPALLPGERCLSAGFRSRGEPARPGLLAAGRGGRRDRQFPGRRCPADRAARRDAC